MAVLLADIGGTKARFCWLEKEKMTVPVQYFCDDFKTPYVVIEKFLKDFPRPMEGMLLAGAGPLQKQHLQWTNRNEWKISGKVLQKKYRLKKILIVNDVQAQGEGLKTLYKCSGTTILMTAGTGLGGCFIIDGKVIPGEIGQIKTKENLKLEDSVSGAGIVRLYHFFGGNPKINSAHQIDELRRKKEKAAKQAYQAFYQKWGEISGQLATALCATGGVYLWGGLIPTNEYDKKTLMKAYQAALPPVFLKIPLRLVKDRSLAFKGLQSLSNREFG